MYTQASAGVVAELGDALWRERGEVEAAHACYVAAGCQIQAYSPSARLCLVGADHRARPRTYATPDAVRMTSLLEAALVSANPQAVVGGL